MGDGTDFASYLVARWPAIVRTLVLLGCPPNHAERVAEIGLARCHASWERVRRDDDVDAEVYRAVLHVWDGRRRHLPAGVPVAVPVVPDPTAPDPTARIALLADLQEALQRLSTEDRSALVLRFAAGLSELQVADVLDVSADEVDERVSIALAEIDVGRRPEEAFHEAGTAIPFGQPSVARVVAQARRRRRRRLTWGVGLVAGAVAVAGLVAWVGTRPADPGLPDPVVTREQNPAGIEWYANRVLHLEQVSLELPQLEELVPVPDGVVYGGRDGLVVLVDAAGKLTALGEKAADSTVVGSAERGWVAWVEPGEGSEELVVYDTLTRRELARREVSDAVTIALDQDRVYYTSGGDAWTWQVPGGEPEVLAGDLLDVSSAVRVFQDSAGLIRVSQPLFNVEHTVPGTGALVAPDGDHVLTRVEDPLPDTVVVYDAATGDVVPSGVRGPEVALAAAFGPDDTVVYVVAQRDHAREGNEFLRLSTSGPLLLRTCDLELSTCETNSQFANAGNPVLPR